MRREKIDPYLITIWLARARLSLSDVIKRTVINKLRARRSPEGVAVPLATLCSEGCSKVRLPLLKLPPPLFHSLSRDQSFGLRGEDSFLPFGFFAHVSLFVFSFHFPLHSAFSSPSFGICEWIDFYLNTQHVFPCTRATGPSCFSSRVGFLSLDAILSFFSTADFTTPPREMSQRRRSTKRFSHLVLLTVVSAVYFVFFGCPLRLRRWSTAKQEPQIECQVADSILLRCAKIAHPSDIFSLVLLTALFRNKIKRSA